MNNTAIIIPIRMNSSRLPGKFHQEIAGKPMIYHVIDRAIETGIKKIIVAVDDIFHLNLVEEYGIEAVMTSKDHKSGTDRVYEAICKIDPEEKIKYIVNLQGDLPFLEPSSISDAISLLENDNIDIGTLAVRIDDPKEINDPNVVKIAMNMAGKALYFSRSPIPFNSPIYYHHLGLYSFKREALVKYVGFKQTNLELYEKLEQLRALEHGMNIMVKEINSVPISVDVPEDLEKAREYARTFVLSH